MHMIFISVYVHLAIRVYMIMITFRFSDDIFRSVDLSVDGARNWNWSYVCVSLRTQTKHVLSCVYETTTTTHDVFMQ